MPLCKILKTFPGSQDGTKTETFEEGTERELSDYLMSCVDKSWIQPVLGQEVRNKAIHTEGQPANKKSK